MTAAGPIDEDRSVGGAKRLMIADLATVLPFVRSLVPLLA